VRVRVRLAAAFAVLAVLVVAAAASWFVVSSLQQDFAAYWVAGRAARRGLDPYVNQVAVGLWDGVALFRHSRFLYPPLLADFFRPLAALPYGLAKAVFTALAVTAWIGAAVQAGRLAGGASAISALCAGALFAPLYLHLERGQIDLFVLVLLLATIAWRERPLRGGVAMATAVLCKPAAIGLLPLLLVARRFRLCPLAAAAGAGWLLVTLLFAGPARTREYVREVAPRVVRYGEGGTEAMLLDASLIAAAGPRMDGRTYPESALDLDARASLPRLLAPQEPRLWAFVLPYAVLAAGLGWAGRRARGHAQREVLLLAGALPLCVVASPTGWAMGCVWALPLVPLGLSGWHKRPAAWAIVGAGWLLVALPDLLVAQRVLGLIAIVVGVCAALASREGSVG